MANLVSYYKEGNVAVIAVDNPPVNALSPGVPEGIMEGLRWALMHDDVEAVVLAGRGRTFIAGADIREFEKMHAGHHGSLEGIHLLLADIEDSDKPVIAAIHGTALGGGLEVAMACHYRVAVPSAQVGQPEVKLGIIPGGEGTQRLPRLAGVRKALEMCAFGEPIRAAQAKAAGIVDELIEGDLLPGAIAFARQVTTRTPPLASRKTAAPDPEAVAAAHEAASKRLRGQTAPHAAIDAVEAASRLPFREGCQVEARLFAECLASDQSKALIHAFFGERTVSKVPGIGKDVEILPIRRAGVVGAGTMGAGIAMVYANAGIPVLLKEANEAALDRGMATIAQNYANSVKRGRFTAEFAEERLRLITPHVNYSGFEAADIVIEAVFENMELKKRTFAELDKVTRSNAILATNTSTLNIDEIASATSRPWMVAGHHFFSPANVMRLIEIVRGKETSAQVIATSMDLARRLRKVGVLVGNCRGFAGNRMFAPYCRESVFLVEEGNTPEQVDGALYGFGMAMGPLAVQDLAGLDVGCRIRSEFKHLEQPGLRYPELDSLLYGAGHYGQKTGRGFYIYDAARKPSPNPEVLTLAKEYAAKAGIAPHPASIEEIVERCVYALINEGARVVEEGIALRSVDLDIIYINGYGFPSWRGGPMKYADLTGLPKVYAKVRQFHDRFGEHWKPAPLLEHLARHNSTFSAYDKSKAGAA